MLKKTLTAAIKICEAGNTITLDAVPGNSFIRNKATGETTPVHIRNGEFQFDLWVEPPDNTMNVIEETRNNIKEEIEQCIANISIYNKFDELAACGEKTCDRRPFPGQAVNKG